MEIINAIIENTNSPEIQAILAKLNPEEDILFTNESDDGSKIEVEYIEPINNVKVIGNIPDNIINDIKEKYCDNASVDIYDYIVTYDQGVYGLAADIEVEKVEDNEKPVKEKKLPLPLLIVVGTATALLTIILIIVKLIFSHKNKK